MTERYVGPHDQRHPNPRPCRTECLVSGGPALNASRPVLQNHAYAESNGAVANNFWFYLLVQQFLRWINVDFTSN